MSDGLYIVNQKQHCTELPLFFFALHHMVRGEDTKQKVGGGGEGADLNGCTVTVCT